MPQIIEVPGQGQVEFPDGMSDEQIVAAIKKLSVGVQQPQPPKRSAVQDIAGAAVEPLVTLATGAVAQPIAGIAGLATGISNALGGSYQDPGDVVRNISNKLTYEPGTEGGKNAMSVISWPFEKLAEGADYVGEKVTDLTNDPAKGAAANTVVNMIPALFGLKGGKSMVADALHGASTKLMTSALKPPPSTPKGQSARAVQTLLDEGANPTESGVRKLSGKAAAIDDEITSAIANSNKTVSRGDVIRRVSDTLDRFRNQVDPQADVSTIRSVVDRFLNHPDIPTDAIPVQQAQRLKQGTYKQLRDKYGELGSAETESQKALARGLKEEISTAEPSVAPLNAAMSDIMNALNLAERRVAVSNNANPVGFAPVGPTGPRMLALLADRSNAFKGTLARALNPGKSLSLGDEFGVYSTAPQSFNEDTKKRQALIDALMRRR